MVDLKTRTFAFAVNVGKLVADLPKTVVNNVYLNQLIRCSSSVGANYRAAQRAKSDADFINKLKIVEEECDESVYFLELLKEFNPTLSDRFAALITVASITTARKKLADISKLKNQE
jgi:four helix bundle protein